MSKTSGVFWARARAAITSTGRFICWNGCRCCFFPWSVFAPVALFSSWRQLWPARSQRQRAAVFLIGGSVWVTLFFSVSDSKIVTYILPVLPMLALLTGAFFDRILSAHQAPRAVLASAGALAFFVASGGVAAIALGPRSLRAFPIGSAWAFALGALLLLWALALMWTVGRREIASVIGVIVGGFTVVFTGTILLVAAIAPAVTSAPMFKAIAPGLRAGAEVVTYPFTQSASFYARRRVYVQVYADAAPHELNYGWQHLAAAEKKKWFFVGIAGLGELMNRPQPTYAILQMSKSERAKTLRAMNGQATQIAENERFSVIANRAALRLTPPNPPIIRARRPNIRANPK